MSVLSTIHGLGSTVLSNLFVTLPYPESVPGLQQQTIVVTGSNTGLGLEASRNLLRLGVGKLIMAVRSVDKGEKARADLLQSTGRPETAVEVWQLDMASYASVQAFAARASTDLPRLDAVLANAGIFTHNFGLAEGGLERTLTVNVVSVVLLYLLLLPKLREAPGPARFVVPNSGLHYMAPVKELVGALNKRAGTASSTPIFDRLNDPRMADMPNRYALSKLFILYATRELVARAATKQPAVVVNAPNPSYCKSELVREMPSFAPPDFFARSTEMGSRALVHAVLAGPETSGHYLTNCHVQTPASHVTSKTGARIQTAFFAELLSVLESIVPGVSANL